MGPPLLTVPSVKPDVGQRRRGPNNGWRQVRQARLVHAAVGQAQLAEKLEGLFGGPAPVAELYNKGIGRQLPGDPAKEVGILGGPLERKGKLKRDAAKGAGLPQRLNRLAKGWQGVVHLLPGVGHVLMGLDR